MAKDTKVQICSKALMILGIEEDIENIDTGTSLWEKRCALIYDDAREYCLTQLIPTFAITPEPYQVTQDTDGLFQIPSDSLRVLLVNDKPNKFREIGGTIQCDFNPGTTIDIIYVKNISDTGSFTREFSQMLSNEVAIMLAPLTKEVAKINYASTVLMQKRREFAGINAQKAKIKKTETIPFIGKGFFYR